MNLSATPRSADVLPRPHPSEVGTEDEFPRRGGEPINSDAVSDLRGLPKTANPTLQGVVSAIGPRVSEKRSNFALEKSHSIC
jgi:hypothetical protein